MAASKPNPKDFRFLDCKGQTLSKRSGEVRGYDFLIDGCEDCTILVLDHCAQVFVDYCKRCTIVIGAVASSAFVRNCEHCKIKVACGQLRTRDCMDCDFLVAVPGQPIIETSKNMRFGPLLSLYEGALEHLEQANIPSRMQAEGGRCQWQKVYDFSPNDPPGGHHWSPLTRSDFNALSRAFPAETCEVSLTLPTDTFPDAEEEAAAPAGDGASDDAGSISIEEIEEDDASLKDGGFDNSLCEVRAKGRAGTAGLIAQVTKALENAAPDAIVWLAALGFAIPSAVEAGCSMEAQKLVRIVKVTTKMHNSSPQIRIACSPPSKNS
mmetsp:Transcript_73163/g.160063  ORF Transcript_73163/g.160063 Transcript_73163/m.160063 type:complete len:323 (-) Transcript_73163:426-1394(-)